MKKLSTLIALMPLIKSAWDWWQRRKNASNQSGGSIDRHRLGD